MCLAGEPAYTSFGSKSLVSVAHAPIIQLHPIFIFGRIVTSYPMKTLSIISIHPTRSGKCPFPILFSKRYRTRLNRTFFPISVKMCFSLKYCPLAPKSRCKANPIVWNNLFLVMRPLPIETVCLKRTVDYS